MKTCSKCGQVLEDSLTEEELISCIEDACGISELHQGNVERSMSATQVQLDEAGPQEEDE